MGMLTPHRDPTNSVVTMLSGCAITPMLDGPVVGRVALKTLQVIMIDSLAPVELLSPHHIKIHRPEPTETT
jgi:hypothetical protein